MIAGGLLEPKGSLSAIRTILLKKYRIPSIVGATFRLRDLRPYPYGPYPYEKTERVGEKYYNRTRQHLKERPGSRVILIGHSLGGLMSVYVAHRLEREGFGDRLQKIFLLGAPLYGVDPDYLFTSSSLARNITQPFLTHISNELTELTEFLLVDVPREKIVTLHSNSDRLVQSNHATIFGATNIRVHAGHLLMIASVEVAGIIYKNL